MLIKGNGERMSNMFEKILYPTDFSDVSKKALDYIEQLKKVGTKEVIVLIDERGIGPVTRFAPGNADAVLQSIEADSRKEARSIEARLKQKGFTVKVRIEKGIPLREILRVEEGEGVSAIVIGSHGKTNLEEMLLGSVSEKVIRQSKKPVLVIKR
jgi:nucleotide-binding universal stress UspA family protein